MFRKVREGKIQFQYVDALLTNDAQGPSFRVPADEQSHSILSQRPGLCHAGHLELRRRRGYVRVQATGRGCYEVNWNRVVRILMPKLVRPCLDLLDQNFACRA